MTDSLKHYCPECKKISRYCECERHPAPATEHSVEDAEQWLRYVADRYETLTTATFKQECLRVADEIKALRTRLAQVEQELADSEIIIGSLWKDSIETVGGTKTYNREHHVATMTAHIAELESSLARYEGPGGLREIAELLYGELYLCRVDVQEEINYWSEQLLDNDYDGTVDRHSMLTDAQKQDARIALAFDKFAACKKEAESG